MIKITKINLKPIFWSKAAKLTSKLKYRFVSLWAEDLITNLELNISLEKNGNYFVFQTPLQIERPEINSWTPFYQAANRLERHTHDMFGIIFINHPDPRRWTRHQAWNENEYPLRKNFNITDHFIPSPTSCGRGQGEGILSYLNEKTPPDNSYPFLCSSGSGTYEIPVGPIHAGIIEPGHFRFQVAGEDVINLEERLGYVHKGIEKIAEGRDVNSLLKLAGRVSGDSTVAYTWAATTACENIYNLEIPKLALSIRGILAERERIGNHLGDIAAICNDVAFTFAYYQLMRLRELWLRTNKEFFGHRLLMDVIVFGGIKTGIEKNAVKIMLEEIDSLKIELIELYKIFEENSSLHDRLKTTGYLSPEIAKKFGVLGYVARASNLSFDLRQAAPYPPYDELQPIAVPVHKYGDVLARVRVRAQEIISSLDLISIMLEKLPKGSLVNKSISPLQKNELGIGLVEGWRGEIFTYVRLNKEGLVERYFPRDPSWFSWLALEKLIHGNIVPDFPVCNKSINGSYSGVDL